MDVESLRALERESTCIDNVVGFCHSLLGDLQEFLARSNTTLYAEPLSLLGGASIGAHVRHCIEHFECFFEQSRSGVLDYDRRNRNKHLENDSNVALEQLQSLKARMMSLDFMRDLDREVDLIGCLDDQASVAFRARTTVRRELLYVGFHCLHHMAMLAIAARSLDWPVDSQFGKAPSTLAFQYSTT